MYHVSTQGIDERMINVHYYYCKHKFTFDVVILSIVIVCHVLVTKTLKYLRNNYRSCPSSDSR